MYFQPEKIRSEVLHDWIKMMLFPEKQPGRYVVVQGVDTFPSYLKKSSYHVGPCGPNPNLSLRIYRVSDAPPHTFSEVYCPVKGVDYVYFQDFDTAATQQ